MSDGPLRGKRVLVVEDEWLVSMLVEDVLTNEGCVVIGPSRGSPTPCQWR